MTPTERRSVRSDSLEDMPVQWNEPINQARGFARASLAFFLAAMATGLAGAFRLLVAAAWFTGIPALRQFVEDPRFEHYLNGPTLAGSLIAALLLLGGGQRKEGWLVRCWLLVAVCVASLGYWCVQHSHLFGFGNANHRADSDPLTILTLSLLSLIRIVTLAGLAAETASISRGADFRPLRAAATNAAVGAFILWLFLTMTHVDWQVHPPAWRMIRDPQTFLLLVLSIFGRGMSFVLTAVLCAHAHTAIRAEAHSARKAEQDLFQSSSGML